MRADSDYVKDLHANGVHVYCKLAKVWLKSTGKRIGNGSSTGCVYAGKVERFHSHDHDGPLACGCDEYNYA